MINRILDISSRPEEILNHIYVSLHSLLGQFKGFHNLINSLKVFRDFRFNSVGMLFQDIGLS